MIPASPDPASAEPDGGLRVAIMQPTFLPWLGYFALMDAVDVFVYLDDVQLSRQSWQTRNRLKGPAAEVMLTLPVARSPSRPLISDALLADRGEMRKLRRTIHALLGRAPYYDLVAEIVEAGFAQSERGLAALNIALIDAMARAIGINTQRLRSASLGYKTHERGNRLRMICEELEASVYISPPGSETYLAEDAPFADGPVALEFIDFEHPEYPQFHPPFLPYMSALDALAHVGGDGVKALIRAGRSFRAQGVVGDPCR